MTELHVAVDHLKIDYKGPFELNHLIRLLTTFFHESGYDCKFGKDFEINTKNGKSIEYKIYPWKKVSDYTRYSFKIHIIGENITKMDVVRDDKKTKVDNGKLLIIIDAFYDLDYFNKWDNRPIHIFLRALYNKFYYRAYTERFEQRLTHDAHMLHDRLMKFLGLFRSYQTISNNPG